MNDEAKRRGRPPKAPGEKKNVNFTFRARADLREKLSASAEANDRSISEEIERRLEESYTQQDRFVDMLGGYKNLRLITAITTSWKLIENLTNKSWTESHYVFDAMRKSTDNTFAISEFVINANAKKQADNLLEMGKTSELTKFQDVVKLAEIAALFGSSMANGKEPSRKLLETIKDLSGQFKGPVTPPTHEPDV